MLRRTILLSLSLLAAAPPAAAEPLWRYERAQELFESDSIIEICRGQRYLEALIEEGRTHLTVELSERYLDGDGLPRIPLQALYWARAAVRYGHAEALDLDRLSALAGETTRLDLLYIDEAFRRGFPPSCGFDSR